MKIFALVLILSLVGCAGVQFSDDSPTRISAYLAGRGMGIAVNELSTELDAALTKVWVAFMDRTAALDAIPPEETMQLLTNYGHLAALYVNDPYGLTSDLIILVNEFGADYDAEGNMVSIEPIPRIIFERFGQGYAVSRAVVARKNE